MLSAEEFERARAEMDQIEGEIREAQKLFIDTKHRLPESMTTALLYPENLEITVRIYLYKAYLEYLQNEMR